MILDSRNTIHGMGIICSVTPAVSSSLTIPRLEDVSTEDIIRLTEIERKILPLRRKPLKLKFIELNKPVNTFYPLSSAWAATWLLNPRQTLWNGFMQTLNTGNHPDRTSTFFMPMIDLKSTDPVCILSTMHFIAIGDFHQMMSFLGSIGYIMQGSGLQALSELIYPEGSVNSMLNGKDIYRATRAHILIYAVLYKYLTAKLFKSNLGEPSNDGKFTMRSSLQILKELAKGTHQDTISCTMEAHITTLLNKLIVFFDSAKSKTAHFEYST